MLREILARWLDGWRHEPDPAILDEPDDEPLPDDATEDDEAAMAAEYARRRERADANETFAAGLVMASGLDGFDALHAAQGIILERIHHNAARRAWGDKLN